jgi:hypothetical protein
MLPRSSPDLPGVLTRPSVRALLVRVTGRRRAIELEVWVDRFLGSPGTPRSVALTPMESLLGLIATLTPLIEKVEQDEQQSEC